jgi:acetyl-CoA acetyltransferase
MTIRGTAAIVGVAELPIQEFSPGRSLVGLCAEAGRNAIVDAGLRKQDIDGLITAGDVSPAQQAEYMGLRPTFAVGVTMQGASGATGVTVAADAILAGHCNYVLITMGQERRGPGPRGGGGGGASIGSEFETMYGPGAGAGTGYALIYRRHMYEFGTTEEQLARMAVNQRFNALENEHSVFKGKPITVEDVMNSRYIQQPLKLLESVMPCAGATACIVTSAERAKALPHRPVYVLGAGIEQGAGAIWQTPRITTSPVAVSARNAFSMAGYSPRDMQFAEFYD